jgi:hypothetical protein
MLSDGGGKRGARIVVSADYSGDRDISEFGEDGFDLYERIDRRSGVACGCADQILQIVAGEFVKQKFQAGRREACELAIVAMGGAHQKNVPLRRRWLAGFALHDLARTPHGHDLMLGEGANYGTSPD